MVTKGALFGDSEASALAGHHRTDVKVGVIGMDWVRVGVELKLLRGGIFDGYLVAGLNGYGGRAEAAIGIGYQVGGLLLGSCASGGGSR